MVIMLLTAGVPPLPSKKTTNSLTGTGSPDGIERDIRCHHDSSVGDHAAAGAERPAAELHIHGRDKAAGGKGIAAALFNGDRFHAARAAVGVEGDRERGRNHCGILPQSLDLGVSEHDVVVARIVFNAADLPSLEFLTSRRGKAAGGKGIAAAFFNGDRLHAARAAVGVEGDRERGRNHCGILPQSLDLGVSEHDVAVARIVFNAADLPRLEFLTSRRGKAAGGKDVPAAFFNGDRFHAARAAVGVEGDRERGRNHCGILPQSLDLGVSEHDVAVARIVFNAADLPRLEFLTIRRGKAAGGKNIPAAFFNGDRLHAARTAVAVKGDDELGGCRRRDGALVAANIAGRIRVIGVDVRGLVLDALVPIRAVSIRAFVPVARAVLAPVAVAVLVGGRRDGALVAANIAGRIRVICVDVRGFCP